MVRCSICGEVICEDEKYIYNGQGVEIACETCFMDMDRDDLLDFLGVGIHKAYDYDHKAERADEYYERKVLGEL